MLLLGNLLTLIGCVLMGLIRKKRRQEAVE